MEDNHAYQMVNKRTAPDIRIWNNAVHMEWYFKDIRQCDNTPVAALSNIARYQYEPKCSCQYHTTSRT